MSPHKAHTFCRQMLPKVSRTFAINIEVLEGDLYKAVLCGYLFCRIIDTVEDSYEFSLETQERLLNEMIRIFKSESFDAAEIQAWSTAFQNSDANDPEIILARNAHLVFENYLSLPEESRLAIGRCVIEMTQGMKSTLSQKRYNSHNLYTLETLHDLETYCYYVAGTVGILLTTLFIHSIKNISPKVREQLRERQVSFGLGLQFTNVIKDCFTDYGRGWCYIPRVLGEKHGVKIEDFFKPENNTKSLRILGELIGKAEEHLHDALEYTLAIPRRETRIRLFCLWPLFFAIKSLAAASGNINLVTGEKPVKITRQDVYRTLTKTTVLAFSNTQLQRYYASIAGRIRTL